ncbi:MAG: ABC transporter permease [bacterium]
MMFERSTLRDVWDGIRSQPGRIGLSMLAIAIGVASLTMLIGILEGLRTKSELMVQELGANVLAVLQPSDNQTRDQRKGGFLSGKHLELLRANLRDCAVSGVNRLSLPTLGNGNPQVTVVATDSYLANVRQWRLVTGRFLDPADIQNGQRHAVISRRLGEAWNWNVENTIILGGVPFCVVGIVEVGGSPVESELGDPGLILGERVAFVPMTAVPSMPRRGAGETPIDGAFVRSPGSQSPEQVAQLAQRLLSQPGYRVESLSWVTPDSLIRNIRRLSLTIKLTLGGISVLCLILGGTTMMSLMIANVRARVVEIGLRRALGATARDIVALFVVEACVVTAVAGLAGVAGSHILLLLARSSFSVPVTLGYASTILPLLAALVLGAAFAYWPARIAAAIAPSEALRND